MRFADFQIQKKYSRAYVAWTGGNCRAWRIPLNNGAYILITETECASLPDDNATEVDLGFYSHAEDDGEVRTVSVSRLGAEIERHTG